MPVFINNKDTSGDPLCRLVAGRLVAESDCMYEVYDGHTLHMLPKVVFSKLSQQAALGELEKVQLKLQGDFALEMDGDDEEEEALTLT